MIGRYSHPLLHAAATVTLALAAVLSMLPVIWVAALSLKTGADVYSSSFIPATLNPDNYAQAWNQFALGPLFLHSIAVTVGAVLATVVFSCLAAYGFAKVPFRGSEVLFVGILLGIMVPPAAVIIPLFVEIHAMGLYNNFLGLGAAYTAFGLPVGILILRSFFSSIPAELIEAARIDGASDLQILGNVIAPLSKAPIVTVSLLTFLAAWNDFFLALVLLKDAGTYTIPVGVSQFIGQYSTPYELVAAAALIASAPIILIYLVLHSQFERGVTEGAVRG